MKDTHGFNMQHIRIDGESACSIEDGGELVAVTFPPVPSDFAKYPGSHYLDELALVTKFFRQL